MALPEESTIVAVSIMRAADPTPNLTTTPEPNPNPTKAPPTLLLPLPPTLTLPLTKARRGLHAGRVPRHAAVRCGGQDVSHTGP